MASATRPTRPTRPTAPSTMRHRRPAAIDRVPDELLMVILHLVPTVDLARAVQRLSRRFHRLSNEPKLWLSRCRSDFAYWTADKRARLARAGRANTGAWKHMWLERQHGDTQTAWHFEQVLASKTLRNAHLEAICRRGLDAKDFLLRQCHAGDGPDVLARRYYGNTALSSINRGQAVEEWCTMQQSDEFARLDRALGAFDMFVLNDGDEDMDAIERMLDRLADEFRADCPALPTLTTRQTALALVQWVRARDLAGLDDATHSFRSLGNCLIGHALTEAGHPSLPIVSSAIYTCLASRLGLQAYCCAVPGHVYSTVVARPGETVDGTALARPRPTTTTTVAEADGTTTVGAGTHLPLHLPGRSGPGPVLLDNGERMFLDPYSHGEEVRLEALRARLVNVVWGGLAESRDSFLLPAQPSAVVLRVALNLEASYEHTREMVEAAATAAAGGVGQGLPGEIAAREALLHLRRGDGETNLEALLYAAAWAAVLMRPTTVIGWQRWVDVLLARLARRYGEDAWIIERYLVPLYVRHQQYQRQLQQLYPWGGEGTGHDGHANGEGGDEDDEDDYDDEDEYGNRGDNEHDYYSADWTDPRVMVQMVRNLDQRQPVVSRRYTQEIQERVQFRVGQVFRHRRYGFVGIINGWMLDGQGGESVGGDPGLGGTDSDMRHANHRSTFYTYQNASNDRQVVEQTNVELVTDAAQIPRELFFLAGSSFKRFDAATCTFVSNIREFFPDD